MQKKKPLVKALRSVTTPPATSMAHDPRCIVGEYKPPTAAEPVGMQGMMRPMMKVHSTGKPVDGGGHEGSYKVYPHPPHG